MIFAAKQVKIFIPRFHVLGLKFPYYCLLSALVVKSFSKLFALVAQWIRALACGVRGRVFESRRGCSKRSGKSRPVFFCSFPAIIIEIEFHYSGKGGWRAASSNCSIPRQCAGNSPLLDDIKKNLSPEEICLAESSPVIGTHVGPGTLAVVCMHGM